MDSVTSSPVKSTISTEYQPESDLKPETLSISPETVALSQGVSPNLHVAPNVRIASKWLLAFAALLMLGSATFDTTATKYMNKQRLPVCDDCVPTYFQAPLFQTWTGYVGELLFLPVFLWDKCRAKKENRPRRFDFITSPAEMEKPHCPRWMWIFPLLLDFASTSCLNYATMLTQASTVQMLRSFNIILTFLLSAFALKNRLYVHQIFGVILVLIGSSLVGLYAVIYPDTETNYTNLEWLGILTALAGTSLSALQWVLEESIFRRFYCSPLEGVGYMGLYGVFLGAAVLMLAQTFALEDVRGAFYQMRLGERESRIIITFNILYVFSLAINTAAGITVTKLASSLLRTIVNAGRTVSIWAIEMIVGWASFQLLNFIGLIVTVLSMVVYNYNYISRQKTHWFGDRFFRTPAACLPSKFDIPGYDTSPLVVPDKKSSGETSSQSLQSYQWPGASTIEVASRPTSGPS